MSNVKIIKGDLIQLALAGAFDVIAHGVNCQCKQKSGLAPQMVKAFCTAGFALEADRYIGDINKLGQIDYETHYLEDNEGYTTGEKVIIVNCYTQFEPGKNSLFPTYIPLDYGALRLCLIKMNYVFKGLKIGLPWIGCGLAKGNKSLVQQLIEINMKDCDVTIVEYEK